MAFIASILLFLTAAQQAPSFDAFLLRLGLLRMEERPAAVREFLESHKTTPIVEDGSLAHFVWVGKATTVVVNGDLQRSWSQPDTMQRVPCGDVSFFYRSYMVPPDTRIDYQFVVDGKPMTDPRNPRITPSGYGPHSELAMPAFVTNPVMKYRAEVPHGSIDSVRFKSIEDALRPRTIIIYKPANYAESAALPVLYVHDGFEALDDEYFRNVLDNLIADHKIKPVLAVFIPPVERNDEYVGRKQRAFTRMLCDELVPFIDRTYKTSQQPGDRGMMGISNGGHVSLATVLKRPDVFLNVAGQSPTITFQLLEVLDNAAARLSSHKPFRIYIDVGQYDLDYPGADGSFLTYNREFSGELTRAGIKHTYREVNDGHEWANWRERTDDILKMFFGSK
ncbi:MAG TPA: alpha/beta hydrolase-fold protein [Bacteroidota bacterium]